MVSCIKRYAKLNSYGVRRNTKTSRLPKMIMNLLMMREIIEILRFKMGYWYGVN